jgi:hypothetical protein
MSEVFIAVFVVFLVGAIVFYPNYMTSTPKVRELDLLRMGKINSNPRVDYKIMYNQLKLMYDRQQARIAVLTQENVKLAKKIKELSD